MSYLKSQNGKIVIFMHKIASVRVEEVTRPSFDGKQRYGNNYSYRICVIAEGCEINMGNYPTEDDAVAIMNEIISRISKDKSYRIPLRKDDPVYEV